VPRRKLCCPDGLVLEVVFARAHAGKIAVLVRAIRCSAANIATLTAPRLASRSNPH
jgi:hypothetical protein